MNLLDTIRGKHKVMLWLQYSWAQCIPMVPMKNCSCPLCCLPNKNVIFIISYGAVHYTVLKLRWHIINRVTTDVHSNSKTKPSPVRGFVIVFTLVLCNAVVEYLLTPY